MKLPLESTANPPQTDEAARVLEGALRKFLRKEMRIAVLYTRGNAQTLQFSGLLEKEMFALVGAGLARAAKCEPDYRFKVTLTAEGGRRRDELARRDGAAAQTPVHWGGGRS